MTKESLVFLLGIIVLIVPYLGIPEEWKVYILTTTACILIITGYSLRHKAYIRSIEKGDGERDTDSFMESRGIKQEKNVPYE